MFVLQAFFDLGEAQPLTAEVEDRLAASVAFGGDSRARLLERKKCSRLGFLAKSLTMERTESGCREKREAICSAVSPSRK